MIRTVLFITLLVSPIGCGSTLECLSASVRRNMDTSADPCVDFYQYSCGGWNARNPVSAGAITRFGEVVAQNTKSLRNVIESGRDSNVRAVQLAKQFYDSCMDTGRLDSMGSRPLVQLVRSMGGWSLLNIFNSEYACNVIVYTVLQWVSLKFLPPLLAAYYASTHC